MAYQMNVGKNSRWKCNRKAIERIKKVTMNEKFEVMKEYKGNMRRKLKEKEGSQ